MTLLPPMSSHTCHLLEIRIKNHIGY